MSVEHVSPRLASPSAVHGLEGGRQQARRRASRRRTKNRVVSGAMFLVVAGVVGGAGYYLWEFYGEEQDRALNDDPSVVERPTADEMIVDYEEHGPWNGPGAPAFGVGDEQP